VAVAAAVGQMTTALLMTRLVMGPVMAPDLAQVKQITVVARHTQTQMLQVTVVARAAVKMVELVVVQEMATVTAMQILKF
jgi:hypothetical protein